jgi:hypothetical protein
MQDFSLKYLTKRARACYWLKLLQEFSKLLSYKCAFPFVCAVSVFCV